jgi:membrane protein implicated in regulation of membrane protease activity
MILRLGAALAVRGFGLRFVTRLITRFLGLPWWVRIVAVIVVAVALWWLSRRGRGGGPTGWGRTGRRTVV